MSLAYQLAIEVLEGDLTLEAALDRLEGHPEAQGELRAFLAEDDDVELALPTLPHIPGYALCRQIGRGGFAAVYEGVEPATGARVAVKVLEDRSADNPLSRRRFEAEGLALRHLSGTEGVPALRAARLHPDHGRPHLIMDLIVGQSWLAATEAMETSDYIRAALALIGVLRACHNRGVVHRDIKPSNILVAASAVYLIDFGIAHVPSHPDDDRSRLTITGQVMGTLSYMAPEQCTGRSDLGPEVDVYGLGVVLYETVAGFLPYPITGRVLKDVIAIRSHPVRALPHKPDRPRGLETLLFAMLDKRPSARPTLAEVARALSAL